MSGARGAAAGANLVLSLALVAGGLLVAPARGADLDIIADARIPMRDGIELSARVWTPSGDSLAPTVFVLTPYVSDETHARARAFTEHGYAYVSVDKRGRGASGGTFSPQEGAGPDGCDVIGWIKRQPWSDGRVVMRGGSYRGMVQWQIAAKCPDELAAIVPTAAAYVGEDFPTVRNEISFSYIARWLAFVSGRTRNMNLFSDTDYWWSKYREMYLAHRPFHELDDIAGIRTPFFDAWVDQMGSPSPERWADDNPTSEEMAAIDMPMLTITGHFDGDQPGALRYYREHMALASPKARKRHYLLMGAWDHGGTRSPQREVGGVTLAPDVVVDIDRLHIEFFDWVLRGGDRPELLRDRVVYYTVGAEEWRSVKRLENVARETRAFFLSAGPDEAADVFSSGALSADPPVEQPATAFVSDPLDLRPADYFGGEPGDFLTDPRVAFLPEMRIFHSAPLEESLTVSGQMKLTLHLSIDTPDTDVFAAVGVVDRFGSLRWLGQDVMRARFREGTGAPRLVEPGVVRDYVLDRFLWTSVEIEPGSRVRLVVGPLNRPDWQKNYNSGGRLGYETAEDARVAKVRIHHDEKHPSRLELPVER